MKRIKVYFFMLIFLLTFANCKISSTQQTNVDLKFNGLYFTEKKNPNDTEDYRYYLRFYENGKVIETASPSEVKYVIKWFNLQMDDLSVGKYTIKKNQISFDIKSEQGVVSYKGEILNNGLRLSSESKINGHKSIKQYQFQNMNLSN